MISVIAPQCESIFTICYHVLSLAFLKICSVFQLPEIATMKGMQNFQAVYFGEIKNISFFVMRTTKPVEL